MKCDKCLFACLRIGMGLIFIWAFFDKLLGLGFATKPESAWLNGGSPTSGFLTNAAKGPFADIYHAMAGTGLVDWLFMLGLLLLGSALILGMGMKLATHAGALLMLLIYLAVLPPTNNLLLDDHIIYGLVLLLLYQVKAGEVWGYGKEWKKSRLVKKYRFLE